MGKRGLSPVVELTLSSYAMPPNFPLDVYCADIGSVTSGNFGWYASRADGTFAQGSVIEELANAVATSLNGGARVALGFEAPMFSPLRRDPQMLTRRRVGETNPNWIGGPGAAVLATALAQVPWILREVKERLQIDGSPTLDWSLFNSGGANLFLWEAFVSGNAKGIDHIEDARIAVNAFTETLPNPHLHSAISEPEVFCLLGAALIRTCWSTDIQLLSQPCIVIKA